MPYTLTEVITIKKLIAFVIASVLVLALVVPALAAESDTRQNRNTICDFVDEDGDGICDSCSFEGVPPRDGTGMKYACRGRAK